MDRTLSLLVETRFHSSKRCHLHDLNTWFGRKIVSVRARSTCKGAFIFMANVANLCEMFCGAVRAIDNLSEGFISPKKISVP
jgi:hypothetical protein